MNPDSESSHQFRQYGDGCTLVLYLESGSKELVKTLKQHPRFRWCANYFQNNKWLAVDLAYSYDSPADCQALESELVQLLASEQVVPDG